MNKELLISIKPEHLVSILNGKKTLELRKTVPKNYKGWVNIYCTKSKKIFRVGSLGFYEDVLYKLPNGQIKFGFPGELLVDYDYDDNYYLNGKVVARFWFDEYIELEHYDFWGESYYWKNTVISAFALEKATCMSSLEMEEYAKSKTLYAWHIKDLEIFDKPKELSDFYVTNKGLTYKYIKEYEERTNDTIAFRLKKAPQSYQFVYVKELENE